MKQIKKIITMVLFACVLLTEMGTVANASGMGYYSLYKKGDKLHTKKSIIKGKKLLKKGTSGGHQYLIIKVSGGKAVLRPQQGYYLSDDPYFKRKKITYKISKNCKFYYRNVMYPTSKTGPKYKRVSRKTALSDMSVWKGYIGEVGGTYYTGVCFGEVYVKNGKIVAVLKDGGD